MKDFGIGNSKFGMEIHENFIPHDALCSTGESLYYNFDYDTNQGIVVHLKIHALRVSNSLQIIFAVLTGENMSMLCIHEA